MSLKPTSKNNYIFWLAKSAQTWAYFAIGAEKETGPEGFENYCSIHGWVHPMNYRKINKQYPSTSPKEALEEMIEVRIALVEELDYLAREMDERVRRLQRMEEQMDEVRKFRDEDEKAI